MSSVDRCQVMILPSKREQTDDERETTRDKALTVEQISNNKKKMRLRCVDKTQPLVTLPKGICFVASVFCVCNTIMLFELPMHGFSRKNSPNHLVIIWPPPPRGGGYSYVILTASLSKGPSSVWRCSRALKNDFANKRDLSPKSDSALLH